MNMKTHDLAKYLLSLPDVEISEDLWNKAKEHSMQLYIDEMKHSPEEFERLFLNVWKDILA